MSPTAESEGKRNSGKTDFGGFKKYPSLLYACRSGNAGWYKDKALEIYQAIVTNNPKETYAAYKTGIIYIGKNDLSMADLILMSEFPSSENGHCLKGIVSYQRKNYAEAMNYLQNALKITPTFEAYYFLGLCQYNRGELESALSQFRKIIDHVPESRQARR